MIAYLIPACSFRSAVTYKDTQSRPSVSGKREKIKMPQFKKEPKSNNEVTKKGFKNKKIYAKWTNRRRAHLTSFSSSLDHRDHQWTVDFSTTQPCARESAARWQYLQNKHTIYKTQKRNARFFISIQTLSKVRMTRLSLILAKTAELTDS